MAPNQSGKIGYLFINRYGLAICVIRSIVCLHSCNMCTFGYVAGIPVVTQRAAISGGDLFAVDAQDDFGDGLVIGSRYIDRLFIGDRHSIHQVETADYGCNGVTANGYRNGG